MLLRVAAQQWSVDKKGCDAAEGAVIHAPSGRRFSYGELVEGASKLPGINADAVPLKAPKDFHLIGKRAPRVDTLSKVDGSAAFGIDVRVPEMLYALIARCPHFGGHRSDLSTFAVTEAAT